MPSNDSEIVKHLEQYIFYTQACKSPSSILNKDRARNEELAAKAWEDAKMVAQQLGIDLGDRLNDDVNRI